MSRREWSTREEEQLRRMARDGKGAHQAAKDLRRTLWSVRRKAAELRISLRTRNEHGYELRGKVLGEPRRGSWAGSDQALKELREAIAAGRADPGQIERFAIAVPSVRPAPHRHAVGLLPPMCRR